MARFKAISTMRRRQNAELDADMIANIPDPADDPEMSLAQNRDAILLRRGLAQLSPAHAEALDLVYYHGKPIAEVAAILGIPEPTVKTRMFYARKKLAEVIQAELMQGASAHRTRAGTAKFFAVDAHPLSYAAMEKLILKRALSSDIRESRSKKPYKSRMIAKCYRISRSL